MARGKDRERHVQRAPIAFAAADGERADGAQQKADDGCFEELLLAHVADRVAQRELDPRGIFPVDVIGDEDVPTAPRNVLRALESPRREDRRESANDRKADAPDPQPLLGKDRRSSDAGQDRVT